jgi:hypothetical protein
MLATVTSPRIVEGLRWDLIDIGFESTRVHATVNRILALIEVFNCIAPLEQFLLLT